MRDFSNERTQIEPGREFQSSSGERLAQMRGDPRMYQSVLSPAELDTFTEQLAARWNACADALELLEREELTRRDNEDAWLARRVLRRAVHGEG